MISHLGILVYLTYAAGLKSVVIRSDTFMGMVPQVEIDPVKGNELGELTLSRRDAGLEEKLAKDVDANKKYVGTHSKECSKSFLMPPPKIRNFSVNSSILEKGETICHWKFIGSHNCLPIVTCLNFSLAESTQNDTKEEPCLDDFLELTDGSYGYQKYCRKNGPVNITAGRSYRDIYMTLNLSSSAKNRSFDCVVKCITDTDDEKIKTLEDNLVPEFNTRCKCGHKSPANLKRDLSKSKHENDVTKDEIPWIAVLVAAGTRNPLCIGSIINDRFILTAAHCFRGSYVNASSLEVLVHPHELNISKSVKHVLGKHGLVFSHEELKFMDDYDKSLRFSIERYFIHPLRVKQTNDFGIALVKLDRPIDFSEKKLAVPICLPESSSWDQNNEGEPALLAGWGLKLKHHDLHGGDIHGIITPLKKQPIEVFHRTECDDIYDWSYSHRMLCAGQRTREKPSVGDIGSPLFSEKSKGIWEQIGVLVYGEGSRPENGPGLYIDLRQVVQWIRYVSSLEKAVWCADNSGL